MLKPAITLVPHEILSRMLSQEEALVLVKQLDELFKMDIKECMQYMLDNFSGYSIDSEYEFIESFCMNLMNSGDERKNLLLDSNGDVAYFWDSVYLEGEQETVLITIGQALSNYLMSVLEVDYYYSLGVVDNGPSLCDPIILRIDDEFTE